MPVLYRPNGHIDSVGLHHVRLPNLSRDPRVVQVANQALHSPSVQNYLVQVVERATRYHRADRADHFRYQKPLGRALPSIVVD